jgi:hypothetical protein
VNAVDRLWRARRNGDWDSIAAQLRPGVRIHLMHEDRELGRDEFVALMRLLHHDATTSVLRLVRGRGLEIAIVATVKRANGTLYCAGFYELREGLIEVIEETWVMRGAGHLLDQI